MLKPLYSRTTLTETRASLKDSSSHHPSISPSLIVVLAISPAAAKGVEISGSSDRFSLIGCQVFHLTPIFNFFDTLIVVFFFVRLPQSWRQWVSRTLKPRRKSNRELEGTQSSTVWAQSLLVEANNTQDGVKPKNAPYLIFSTKGSWSSGFYFLRALDAVVTAEKDLKPACILVSIISSSPQCCLPIYHLSCHRGQLGLPHDLKLSTFIRRYPSVFLESYDFWGGGARVPCFSLTPEALQLHQEEINVLNKNKMDFINRVRKFLMLTRGWTLPLQTLDQLKWDMGLPYDYEHSVISHHPDLFSFIRLPDNRVGLKLLSWDDDLAVSQLQKNSARQQKEEDVRSGCLAFPIGFMRGFGLKRKCMEWLKEWQTLPYTSPYCDASYLDPRTDESEKRIVGVFHELLHLTIHKKTERKNVSNLRKPLALPQKFTKVFERHPGIFYISNKCGTQTVILREAYGYQHLLEKDPTVELRDKLAKLLRQGLLDRSKGLYKKSKGYGVGDGDGVQVQVEVDPNVLGDVGNNQSSSEGESKNSLFCEYDSDSNSLHEQPQFQL